MHIAPSRARRSAGRQRGVDREAFTVASRGQDLPESLVTSRRLGALGFRFICGRSRRGRFALKRKTCAIACGRKLKEIKEEMRPNSSVSPRKGEVAEAAYYGVPAKAFRHDVTHLWRRSRSDNDVKRIGQLDLNLELRNGLLRWRPE
jgi:hypothetical protein